MLLLTATTYYLLQLLTVNCYWLLLTATATLCFAKLTRRHLSGENFKNKIHLILTDGVKLYNKDIVLGGPKTKPFEGKLSFCSSFVLGQCLYGVALTLYLVLSTNDVVFTFHFNLESSQPLHTLSPFFYTKTHTQIFSCLFLRTYRTNIYNHVISEVNSSFFWKTG